MRALVVVLVAFPAAAWASCPSYTASSADNTHQCGVEAAPGTDPTVDDWNARFAVVAGGPASWGADGPTAVDLQTGCASPQNAAATFPCELLKGIAMIESGWKQFCVPDSPADQVGGASRTIISFDCGYGVSQVTSGMHVGETPAFDRARVASDPTYNLATGAGILAQKWRAVACVGDRQPRVIEDWYTAVWAYNGLAYSNNPNNPNYASNRGVWNPSVGGAAPYQEKVFGTLEHATRWAPVALAYPALGDIGGTGAPGALPEPNCASPTDCTQHRQTHVSACAGVVAAVDAGAPSPSDAAVAPVDAVVAPEPVDAAAGPRGDVSGGCAVGAHGNAGAFFALITLLLLRRRREDAR